MYVSYETVRQDGNNTFVHRNYVEEMLFVSQFEAEHRLKELEEQKNTLKNQRNLEI